MCSSLSLLRKKGHIFLISGGPLGVCCVVKRHWSIFLCLSKFPAEKKLVVMMVACHLDL